MEISMNAKQIVILVWTLIAVVISLVLVLALGHFVGGRWEYLVALFFGLLLVITIPVYLLVALWHIVSKWEST